MSDFHKHNELVPNIRKTFMIENEKKQMNNV